MKKIIPLLIVIVLTIVAFWQFFLLGKIPIPADTLTGAYFPWLDYKWGYEIGVPVKNAPISDVFSQFFLWKYLSIDLISSGVWPLWNPYSFSGTPFLATYHSASLFPFNVLLLLPRYFGWGFFIYAQYLMAILGMYFLLGRLVKSEVAKIAGSIVFCFSGLMTTWAEFGTGVWAAAMLPWIFYSLESFFQDSKTRYLILFVLSLVCLFLAGNAQITLYGSILFIAFISFKFLKEKITKKMVFITLLLWLLSIGIVSLQLLPAIDLSRDSIRSDEHYSQQFGYGLSPIYESIRLVAGDFFGNPTTYNEWDTRLYHEYSSFLGTLVLPLMLGLFFKRFRKGVISFWLGVFLSSLFLVFENPITIWFYSLPLPFLTYSSASRILFVTSFCAGILLAFGIETFLKNEEYRKITKKFTVILAAMLIGVFLGECINYLILKEYISYSEISKIINHFSIAIRNLIVPLSLLILMLFLLSIYRKAKISMNVLLIIITSLIFLDLARYFIKYNPFVPSRLVFPQTPITVYLISRPGLFRIADADAILFPPNSWTFYKLASIEGYDPLVQENYSRFFNRLNNGPYSGTVSRYVELRQFPSKFLDALNAKYFLTVKTDDKGVIPGDNLNFRFNDVNYKKIFEDKHTAVLENPDAMERAYFVSSVESFDSEKALESRLDEADFDPTKEALILDKNYSLNFPTDGKIDIQKYSPNTIEIKTETTSSEFMIFADTYSRGWHLYLNSKEVKLFEVNGALRGIMVPSGVNNFKLNYWPNSFDTGLKISVISILIFVFLIIISLVKNPIKKTFELEF